MKAVALHRDVVVVTSQVLQAHCTLVRGPQAQGASGGGPSGERPVGGPGGEAFVIDSPVLPEELELLPAVVEQAGFPKPGGLLATHADWDHVLGPLAYPDATLGCAESTAERLRAEPGAAQRELRDFDEELVIERPRPLALGGVQALPVPGRCAVGEAELELHPATGHTGDGMAVWIPWARVLVSGDYVSDVELPVLRGEEPWLRSAGYPPQSALEEYLATLERLRPLVAAAEHVVPGHGSILDRERALGILQEDVAYLEALRERGGDAELPSGRRSKTQRELHAQNLARL
ncbi:MAG TPA: MBL fold metallo-hydrolase [Solirubrobacteraceae bacterium]|nr:MBL fold metallo-hydrolase [Solirubrobacteraceae bacterium]HUB06688.1 MBL fold metallo-hydrolase [Myxococcales bacterium]